MLSKFLVYVCFRFDDSVIKDARMRLDLNMSVLMHGWVDGCVIWYSQR